MKTRMTMAATLMAAGLAAATLWGCPDQGATCSADLTPCGNKTCEDTSNDKRNCGGCGISCQVGEICKASECSCAPGAAECNGACVVLSSNPQHCGSCTNACGAMQVCDDGTCKEGCSAGATKCGQSCVRLESDPFNCGGCGLECDQGMSCHQGLCSYDVVLACFTNGQVRGLQNGTFVQGPREQLGSGPQALDLFGGELLLSVDGIANRLFQAPLTTLQQLMREEVIGAAGNDVLVDGDYVYVIASTEGTLTVFKSGVTTDGGTTISDAGAPDAGVQDAGTPDAGELPDAGPETDAGTEPADAGLAAPWEPIEVKFPNGVDFGVVAQLNFGPNTYPQVITRVVAGNRTYLYVTLLGGFGAGTTAPGQRVVEIDVTTPESAAISDTFDLTPLALQSFDAGAGPGLPRPSGITHRGGVLYVALGNLDENFTVAGPAYLATLPLDGGTGGLVKLPEDKCLNAAWTATVGDHVVVSCAGQTDFSMFPVVTTKASGVAVIGPNNDVLSSVSVACPAGGDGGCAPPSLGRFSAVGNTLYVADQAAGRLFVFDIVNNQLAEKRTYANGQEPLLVCPVGETGYSNVSDVLAVP